MICSLNVRRGCFLGGTGLSSSLSRLILTLILSVADRLIGGAQAASALLSRAKDEMVDDRFGRTVTVSGELVVAPDDRLDGKRLGRSPSFSTQEQASRKLLVNMVGSALVRTSSFT